MKWRTLLLLFIACGGEKPKPAEHASLGGGVVARVDDVDITTDVVSRVANAQNVDAKTAADLLIDDALAAKGARAKGIDKSRSVQRASNAVLARTVLDRLSTDATAKGPPTDAEIEELTKFYWRLYNLPETTAVIHAVVLPGKKPSDANAASVAGDIRDAVVNAKDGTEFEKLAKSVDTHGLELRVEWISAFVADGRMVEGGSLDGTFVKAAFEKQPGETTPVVHTSFGWHVIRVLERHEAKSLPLEQRRVALADEVQRKRAHDATVALVSALKKQKGVTIDPSATDSMAQAMRGYLPSQ